MTPEIRLHTDDGYYIIREWSEINGYVELGYKETECEVVLPVMNKKQWEQFRKQVDNLFQALEDE